MPDYTLTLSDTLKALETLDGVAFALAEIGADVEVDLRACVDAPNTDSHVMSVKTTINGAPYLLCSTDPIVFDSMNRNTIEFLRMACLYLLLDLRDIVDRAEPRHGPHPECIFCSSPGRWEIEGKNRYLCSFCQYAEYGIIRDKVGPWHVLVEHSSVPVVEGT